MVQRHPRRTDQEWMALIQECRTSGLTDKAWCEQHHIQRSNFYYHILKCYTNVVTVVANKI